MLLTGMPTVLQTPGKMGFVRSGVGPKPQRSARFGSAAHYEGGSSTHTVPSPAHYEGEPNTYTGSLAPFYYSARQWWFDPTLKYQAPRPGSHDWYDETLVIQAQRGPDELYDALGAGGVEMYGAAGEEMSFGTKLAIGIGAGALILGGAALIVRGFR